MKEFKSDTLGPTGCASDYLGGRGGGGGGAFSDVAKSTLSAGLPTSTPSSVILIGPFCVGNPPGPCTTSESTPTSSCFAASVAVLDR